MKPAKPAKSVKTNQGKGRPVVNAHMIIDAGDGTYGVVEVDLNDPHHEDMDRYQHDDVAGSYSSVTEAALEHIFGQHGFKVHPDLQGKV